MDIKIIRTGRVVSIAGSQFLVTFPNGDQISLWSPPWHEMDQDEEYKGAVTEASQLWLNKSYTKLSDDELNKIKTYINWLSN